MTDTPQTDRKDERDLLDRYVALRVENGVLIFDVEDHRAWLESDAVVALTEAA